MAKVFQSILRKLLDVMSIWFRVFRMSVFIYSQVLFTLEWLGMFFQEVIYFSFINPNRIVLYQGGKFMQDLVVVVFRYPCVESVIPSMHPANKVVPFNMSISHQGTAMQTPSIEDGYFSIVRHYNQIKAFCLSMDRNTILQRGIRNQLNGFLHDVT